MDNLSIGDEVFKTIDLKKEYPKLVAENKRLRDALEKIVADWDEEDGFISRPPYIFEIAYTALFDREE